MTREPVAAPGERAAAPLFVLGSGSPRRRDLLAQIGLTPDRTAHPDIDEAPLPRERPRDYCLRIAREKMAAIPASADEVVLTADTTVALGRRILGKPADADEARRFLSELSGRRHRVISAVAVRRGDRIRVRDNLTTVRFKRLSDREVEAYVASGDWQGKAGGYAIQGPAAAFAVWIQGSYSGVMGLPLAETAALLQDAGLEIWR